MKKISLVILTALLAGCGPKKGVKDDASVQVGVENDEVQMVVAYIKPGVNVKNEIIKKLEALVLVECKEKLTAQHIKDTKIIETDQKHPSGFKMHEEKWTIAICGKELAYRISFTAYPEGATGLHIMKWFN